MNATRHRIVVGVDGSPASVEAVRWAANYATLAGVDLQAVTSWTAPGSSGLGLGVGYDTADLDWQAIAEQTQQTALAEALPGHASPLQHTVVFDHPAAALIAAAEGADLLVVGSRGHGGFAGMLLGSVSAHVAAHAPCPVLVIRHSFAAGDSAGTAQEAAAVVAPASTVTAPVMSTAAS